MYAKTLLLFLIFPAIITAGASPQQRVPLADPFIILHDGTYYAYGTHSERGIEVYTSDDLSIWSLHDRLALDRNDSWGERYFRAPEVYIVDGKFHMYYNADTHLCVAVSDSPLGPFIQPERKPLIDNEETVDASVFRDDKGKAYLFFVRKADGMSVWTAELTVNMLGIKPGTMRKCISVSQPWEKVWANVMEGPFVFKRNDTYYMLYSANSHESHSCGIGYATAPNVWGPWTKHTGNPILRKPGKLVGIGHCSLFSDKQGALRMVFHSHYDDKRINPRVMHISRIKLKKSFNGNGTLSLDKFVMTPVTFQQ